jgi:tetratricopeptide (TPR) repeat protein
MKTILNEYSKQEGPLDKARSEECLELCRRGIEEFQHFAWAPNVIGSFHLVHGTIDVYLGESLGAKLHLKRALAEAESVTTRFDRMARNESRAWAHVSLGDLAAMESAWDEACNHYETARRLSKDIIKLAAVSRLANIYLEFLKNPKMALRVLVRVQGKLGLLVEKDPVRDEIRWQTAKSYWLCGRKMHSMKLYRAIAKDADSEKLKKQVGEWLKKVSESKGKRRIPDG